MGAGVEPGVAALHDLNVELAQIQIGLVDGGDFELAPSAGLDGLGDVHDLVVVEVQAGDGVVALGLCWLFFDAAGLAIGIKSHHAVALGVLHMVGKDCGAAGFSIGLGQQGGKVVAVEDVVAQHQSAGLVAHELVTDDEGLGQTIFGSDIYKIDIGMPKDPIFMLDSVFPGGVLVNKEDVYAAAIAAALVVLLSVFFQKTTTGRALRAVADDHQAAQSIGIPLNRIWVIVWCVAGVVALVAGMIWGSKLGVQFSLTTVALRALPVVILGGLTSVPGAIIGGLIIGVGEKLSEVYLGPYVGGGIEIWFAYVLALTFLLFRPQGLFGEKIIDRV